MVVADQYFSSHTTSFRTPVAVAEVAPDVGAASARCPDYLVADCIDWMVKVGSLG